jgi:hypothetical protein
MQKYAISTSIFIGLILFRFAQNDRKHMLFNSQGAPCATTDIVLFVYI